jgi:hypothetical protein
MAGIPASARLRKQKRGGLLLQEDVDQDRTMPDVGRNEGRVGPQRGAPNQATDRETTFGRRTGGLLRPQDTLTGDVGMAPSKRDDNRGPIADAPDGVAHGDMSGGTGPTRDVAGSTTPQSSEESREMTDAEVQSAIHKFVWDAIEYADQELSPARALADKYYKGDNFGNEIEGRSQVVLTDLRDTVLMIMPSLVRLFFGVEHPIEYIPHQASQIEMAEQATEYIWDVVVNSDNRGYLVFYEWFKDALLKNLGVIKYWYDDAEESKVFEATFLSLDALQVLEKDDSVQVLSATPTEGAPQGLFDVEYKQRRSSGRLRLIALPPEEFIFTRGSRTTASDASQPGVALFVGHRTELSRSQLLAMGIDEDIIEEYAFKDSSLEHNLEEIQRQGIVKPDTSAIGPIETQKALYIEGYPYLDYDGDGIAELRKVCMLGPGYHVISNDAVDERPFAVITPDPEAHAIIGQGPSDWTMDLQKIKSMTLRAIMDSLALSLNPRLGFVEGEVSLEDIMNEEVGAPIRMRSPQALQPVLHDFVGDSGLRVIQYLDAVKDDRVGALKESNGLTPDALQSITPAAASAAITSAQAHIEMLARNIAEMGVAPLFRGLLRLLVLNQAPERIVRMRGKYVPMDPRAMDADLDVRINIAVGTGLLEEKIATLENESTKMEGIFNTMGLSNPFVTARQYRDLRVKILKLRGFPDAEQAYQQVPVDWTPPPPDPNAQNPQLIIAQAEAKKADADVQKKQADSQRAQEQHQAELAARQKEIDLKHQENMLDMQRQQQKDDAELALQAKELSLKYGVQLTVAQMKEEGARSRQTEKTKVTRTQPSGASQSVEHHREGPK